MSRRLREIVEGTARLGPETVHLDLTNGCNTNCITCWDHSPLLKVARGAAWKRQRVDAGEVEALLDDLVALGGLKAIILSGMGEPFTHPDIYRLIAAVKARGLHLTIITNLIPADAARVIELGVDTLLIGIHAAGEAAYRAFHPSFRSDEWEVLHAMLERFRAAGRRDKHVQVICRANAEEVPEMVRLAHRYRAGALNYKLAGLREGTEAARIREDQRAWLLAEGVPAATALAAELGVETNLDVFAAQLGAGGGDTAPIADVGCVMGHVYARVLVDGTVLYCCNTEVVVGSLSQARFSELWRGARWNEWRARLRAGQYLPSCGQCGKLNQNVKIGRKLAAAYGEETLRRVTGRGA